MLKQCLENIGEGLLHACISSIIVNEGIASGVLPVLNAV